MADLASLTSWRSNWSELRVAIYGVGVSGFAVADTLQELGSTLLVVADRIEDGHADLLSVLGIESVISTDKKILAEEG